MNARRLDGDPTATEPKRNAATVEVRNARLLRPGEEAFDLPELVALVSDVDVETEREDAREEMSDPPRLPPGVDGAVADRWHACPAYGFAWVGGLDFYRVVLPMAEEDTTAVPGEPRFQTIAREGERKGAGDAADDRPGIDCVRDSVECHADTESSVAIVPEQGFGTGIRWQEGRMQVVHAERVAFEDRARKLPREAGDDCTVRFRYSARR